ncbi:MAG: pyridoxal phosphate-dependent transferase [Monoraphidium minutum]|nr:MAG: pyridoxal phosphate-dependent transferase [Monoraphidium minutum]
MAADGAAAKGAAAAAGADGAAAAGKQQQEPEPQLELPHLSGTIYLDYNATTPILPEARDAMLPFTFEQFGNPSSAHAYGRRAAAAVAAARASVAKLVGAADPSEIYFTSCGTEADAWAIWGAVMARRKELAGKGALPHVVTTAVEHPAVTACLQSLADQGLCTFTAVGVDAEGLVSAEAVAAAVTPETVLVTVMHANNEVGSIQPVADISAAIKASGALLHTDAAQSIGKIKVDVRRLAVDMLTIVGHKFGAPKGVAALYIRKGVSIAPLLSGGGQERGGRAGTESTLLIAGFGAAAEAARRDLAAGHKRMRAARDVLQERLLAGFCALQAGRGGGGGGVRVNGPADAPRRLPNTLSISVGGLRAAELLAALGDRVAASSSAACHSGAGGGGASATLRAMGVAPELAIGTLRLSTGRFTTMAEAVRAADIILEAARRQRGGGGLFGGPWF